MCIISITMKMQYAWKKILRTKVNNDFNVKTIMMKICGKLSDECVFFFFLTYFYIKVWTHMLPLCYKNKWGFCIHVIHCSIDECDGVFKTNGN